MSRSTTIHNDNCNKLSNMHQLFFTSLCVSLESELKKRSFPNIFLMASAVGVSLDPSNELIASSNEIL